MPSAKEDMDGARALIDQASVEERCLEEATATAECVRNLKDAMEITSSEWRDFAWCGAFIIGGIAVFVLAPGPGWMYHAGIAETCGAVVLGMAGGSCSFALRLVIRILKRIKRTKNSLETTTRQLKNCLKS